MLRFCLAIPLTSASAAWYPLCRVVGWALLRITFSCREDTRQIQRWSRVKIEARVVPWRDIQRNTSPGFHSWASPTFPQETYHPSITNINYLSWAKKGNSAASACRLRWTERQHRPLRMGKDFAIVWVSLTYLTPQVLRSTDHSWQDIEIQVARGLNREPEFRLKLKTEFDNGEYNSRNRLDPTTYTTTKC